MKWIIEKGLFKENLERLYIVLEKQGIDYEVVKYIPFQGGSYSFDSDCFFYGSLEFAAQLRKETECTIFSTPEFYDCTKYYPAFGEWLINGDYMMLPYGDLLRRAGFISEFFGMGEHRLFFVRPNSGEKTFTGMTMATKIIKQDMEFVERYSKIPPDTLIIIASAKKIYKEYRFIMRGNEVVTGSLYKIDGNNETKLIKSEDEAFSFAKIIGGKAKYRTDPMWTLDIAELESGKLGVLEIGGFSCAGWYDCDVDKIIKNVKQIFEGKEKIRNE